MTSNRLCQQRQHNGGGNMACHAQDYRPMVELCKAAGVPVVCANAPRRYVSIVGKRGMVSTGYWVLGDDDEWRRRRSAYKCLEVPKSA